MNVDLPLQLTSVSKSYGSVHALVDIDIEMAPGELLALVGPSGCGKSTLLRVVAGLTAVDSGTIRIAGDVVDDGRSRVDPEHRRHRTGGRRGRADRVRSRAGEQGRAHLGAEHLRRRRLHELLPAGIRRLDAGPVGALPLWAISRRCTVVCAVRRWANVTDGSV